MIQHKSDYDWQRADERLEPALLLTWVLGIAAAVLMATAL